MEDSGRRPTTRFGVYEYDAILETFRTRGFRVLSTQRGKDADVVAAARDTAAQVRDLLRAGVPASHVTVIGASKGSVITMLASTELQNPEVRYVLLGNCNDSVFQRRDTRLSGRVLSIFEETDEFGGTCEAFFSRPGALTAHDEVHLRLGINHAFLYSPVEEWVAPATEWARHAKLQR
ncbi:MAG TPA: alpha/beta hydrolase [Thermoanaerobaculia bacterium]|nr:alpha/beta hydrolase [Thermoanaerobaculia bacterium]